MRWKDKLTKKLKRRTRERTPAILQMDNTECGAVALAIMLAYFGRYVPLSEVREACDVSRDGSKAINIVKAARHYGLDAHGMQLNMDNIKLLPPPFIVYWQFNHFLIVEGFKDNEVYLNDPATGPRRESIEAFSRSFTGVVLFMAPGVNFKPAGQPEAGVVQLLWQSLAGSRESFFYIILVSLALAAPSAALAFFAKIFLDNIFLGRQYDLLPGLLVMMLTGAIMMAVLTWLKRHYLIRLYMKLKTRGMVDFFGRLLQLPLPFFQQRAPGDIVERLETHSDLSNVLAEKMTENIAGLFTIIILFFILFLFSWPLMIINLSIVLINFFLFGFISRRNTDLRRRFAQAAGKLSGIEMNGLHIIETLKASAVEDHFFNDWAAAHAQKVSCEQNIELNESHLANLPIFLHGLNIALVLGVGSWLVLQGQLTPGGLVAILILMMVIYLPLMELLEGSENLYKLRGGLARMQDVTAHSRENILSDERDAVSLPMPDDQPLLIVRDAVFGYSKLEPPILNGISFQIKAGERIAIIGPTGGGKSSIARLICGLYAPWSGEILIQGMALSKLSRADLAKCIGLVDQQIFLFAASVRDNMTLWNPHVTDSEIFHALKTAQIADIVRQRGGLDCWIEERGSNFSTGQVQRLEIARALIGKPALLILDEATAALDPLIEQQIYANLQQQHCALVIIAHRLSAIRDSEQIVVIDNGKIVQSGRHESLIKDSGLYKDLVSLEIQ